ncbi:MAG: hypothetical protein K6C12_08765 [Oscillospiraceae bacterium]|nr:hypothetical protein [Oscillospiraceae bacterium]
MIDQMISVPIAASYIVEGGQIVNEEITYGQIPVQILTDFLLQGFAIDSESLCRPEGNPL